MEVNILENVKKDNEERMKKFYEEKEAVLENIEQRHEFMKEELNRSMYNIHRNINECEETQKAIDEKLNEINNILDSL